MLPSLHTNTLHTGTQTIGCHSKITGRVEKLWEKKGRVRGRDMEEGGTEGERERREGVRKGERERGKEGGDSLDWHQGGKSWAGVHSCSARPGGSQQ